MPKQVVDIRTVKTDVDKKFKKMTKKQMEEYDRNTQGGYKPKKKTASKKKSG